MTPSSSSPAESPHPPPPLRHASHIYNHHHHHHHHHLRWEQLSFLHYYHHVTIYLVYPSPPPLPSPASPSLPPPPSLSYWMNANVGADGDIYLTVVLNCFVHCVMYALAALQRGHVTCRAQIKPLTHRQSHCFAGIFTTLSPPPTSWASRNCFSSASKCTARTPGPAFNATQHNTTQHTHTSTGNIFFFFFF